MNNVTADSFEMRKQNPRKIISSLIKNNNLKELLLQTGQIHGHYCPGVTIGVIAAYMEMKRLNSITDGLEDLVAIVEVNSCFVDGIQFVSGCTIGNNSLIYRDIGKTAVTFVARNSGKGKRYILNREYYENKYSNNTEHRIVFEKVVNKRERDPSIIKKFKEIHADRAFEMLDFDFESLFKITDVELDIPVRSKIFDSFLCSNCKESTMITRKTIIENRELCPNCDGVFYQLSGNGIEEINS